MKHIPIFLLIAVLISTATALGQSTNTAAPASVPQAQPSPPPTIASAVDSEISNIERQIIDVAEAMPEDKYNFSPESFQAATSRVCVGLPSKSSMSPRPTISYGPILPAISCRKA
jgi:hypothetical protein